VALGGLVGAFAVPPLLVDRLVCCSLGPIHRVLPILKWARANGCAWDEWTCAYAAIGGHLSILKWARDREWLHMLGQSARLNAVKEDRLRVDAEEIAV